MIRNQSKLTDQLITIDSPRRNTKMLSKSVCNTIMFRKKLQKSKCTIFAQTQSLWVQSATSNTREKSPSFKFTQMQRFSSVDQDERRNRLILKLNLANELTNSKGVSFAKSKRIDHFKPKKIVEDYPSPATYYSKTFTPTSSKKRISNSAKTKSSFIKLIDDYMNYEIKGATFPKEKNLAKIFMHHGQKLPYQPQITISNPGVGRYIINPQNQMTTKKFVIGQTLKKFNEFIAQNPGPESYGKESQMLPKRVQSANCKGTFQKSKRTYLVNNHPENFSPAPDSYNIQRFMGH